MRDAKQWLNDLFDFIWAVINSWAGYTTGGLIVALVWLWSTVYERAVSRRAGLGLAFAFLFMAFFNAWRKQYRRVLVLEQEKRLRNDKVALIHFVSAFATEGESLLHINPDETATEEDIAQWKFKVEKWKEKVSSVLWALARNKFDQLLDVEFGEFYGAHKSIWSDLSILRQRVRNLKEIMEKPNIYLARI